MTTLNLTRGVARPYADPKRWLYATGLPHAAVPSACMLAYGAAGIGAWILLMPYLWMFVSVPIIDRIVGQDRINPPETAVDTLSDDPFYSWLVYLQIPIITSNFVLLMWTIATQNPPWWAAVPLFVCVGLSSGKLITLAHELGHRTNARDPLLARIALSVVGYGHFCIEHNRGHHVRVATPEDCSSARMGESVYAFAMRDMRGALVGGWRQEARRLQARGYLVISWRNELLQSYALTLAIAAGLAAWLGWVVLPLIVLHHFLSWYALSLVNYIEHYGLLRRKLPNGRYEPCQPHHSWNTDFTFSNLLQINLQRHSDHHANPQRPYQCLRTFEGLPTLPTGYPGCFSLAAIPPLWRRAMDPRVMEWADGDIGRVNTVECKRSDHSD